MRLEFFHIESYDWLFVAKEIKVLWLSHRKSRPTPTWWCTTRSLPWRWSRHRSLRSLPTPWAAVPPTAVQSADDASPSIRPWDTQYRLLWHPRWPAGMPENAIGSNRSTVALRCFGVTSRRRRRPRRCPRWTRWDTRSNTSKTCSRWLTSNTSTNTTNSNYQSTPWGHTCQWANRPRPTRRGIRRCRRQWPRTFNNPTTLSYRILQLTRALWPRELPTLPCPPTTSSQPTATPRAATTAASTRPASSPRTPPWPRTSCLQIVSGRCRNNTSCKTTTCRVNSTGTTAQYPEATTSDHPRVIITLMLTTQLPPNTTITMQSLQKVLKKRSS